MPTTLLIIRHGDVPGIDPPTFRGRAELALTALGRQQAELTATYIQRAWRASEVLTSPLQRCVETGSMIAKAAGVRSRIVEGLNDLDYGAWQMKPHALARAENPALFAGWLAFPHRVRFPGGESLQALVARTGEVLREILAGPGDRTIVLVGHDSVNRALLLQLLDMPLSSYWTFVQRPCGISEVQIEDQRARAVRINETAHLYAASPS